MRRWKTVSVGFDVERINWDDMPLSRVGQILSEKLEEMHLLDRLDYFNMASHGVDPSKKITEQRPSWRWISCWATVGGSEGYYIHVDLIHPSESGRTFELTNLFLGKTFEGLEFACDVAKILTILLEA